MPTADDNRVVHARRLPGRAASLRRYASRRFNVIPLVSAAFRGRLARRGGTPREGVRSEARAKQRLAAGGGLPRSAARRAEWAAPLTQSVYRSPIARGIC